MRLAGICYIREAERRLWGRHKCIVKELKDCGEIIMLFTVLQTLYRFSVLLLKIKDFMR